ncbi:asparagine synthase (glutamine-hydrolyzing) [Caulobacter ginsengisoli]|uniref:asparagine synthase (glutamine-hydrolyzing) n=1 Tax=Caulobacter ginsengisoli TaxID=400775 RepID=A0ABU0IQI9_9CAUL|nr:asparagine synthase (glutamine-hydrolyzing) [Caulobacter ginsengisoli]MDQ0463438.1 asparagine synthase (glutamine-hydrolyzing) [Caulobacter ginsengisoli]
MCGIAGVLGGGGSARPLIDTLQHRGPNGIRIEQVGDASLAHARLSIIDLEGGWQPLHAAGSTIIGNGEIYNYLELAEAFQLKGRLGTGSDFEPLLHIYAQEGEKAFERLRGMYAFCLIGCDGRTWLVRDPFGIKPLSVTRDGNALSFASEPRALFAAGKTAKMARPEALEDLLALGYVAPDRIYANTIWRGLEAVEPGEIDQVIVGDREERLQPAIPPMGTPVRDEADALARLDAVLEDSVKVHQRSDVPYGLFLSGGVDSATVATLMARLNERPVTAFTCGFDAPGARDERAQAERVARALDLDWRETSFGEEDFWRIAPQVAWALDEPTADYAALPTYKLAEAAKGTLTVILTGEGGDELFAGYGRYRRAQRPAWLGGRAAEPQIDAPFLKDRGHGALARWRAAAQIPKSMSPAGYSPLQRAQWGDIATWLPNDLLLKLDRCLMANGLEGRTPFLDKEVAALAFHLPDTMKIRDGKGKWLLRKWLERHCPAADPWGKKKGFTVPVADWIAPRAADLGPRIAGLKAVTELCKPEAVRAVFTDDTQAHNRWPLLFFALWSLIHLENVDPAGALKELLP